MTLPWLFSTLTMLLGTSMLIPQLVRTLRTRSASGVSLVSLASGLVGYLAWMMYGAQSGAASTLFALLVPTLVQLATLWAAARYGAERSSLKVPAVMGTLLLSALLVIGWDLFAVALSVAVFWTYAPAVWAAWRARDVSGVSPLSWVLAACYGIAWGGLGVVEGDLAVALSGAGNLLLPLAVLVGMYSRPRCLPLVVSPQRSPLEMAVPSGEVQGISSR